MSHANAWKGYLNYSDLIPRRRNAHFWQLFKLGKVGKEDRQGKTEIDLVHLWKSMGKASISTQYMIKYTIILPIWRVILDSDHFDESGQFLNSFKQ